jgi:hypothetical protein
MRWLIALPFDRPGHMDVDFADGLTALGHRIEAIVAALDERCGPA